MSKAGNPKRQRDLRNVSFGENDTDLIEFLKDKGRFSTYIKELLREEIVRQNNQAVSEKIEQDQLKKDVAEILQILKSGSINVAQITEQKSPSQSEKTKKKRNKFSAFLQEAE